MKNISTILSVLSLALSIILLTLFLQRRQPAANKPAAVEVKAHDSGSHIAYFDIDSLEANYQYFKDAAAQVKDREAAMNAQLSSLERKNQQKIAEWQQRGSAMTQAETEKAQQEYAQMQQQYQNTKQNLSEELFKENEALKQGIKKKIEDFLRDYNKTKGYTFVFAYDPNSFMYYRDSVYNITDDLVNGLNAKYSDEKKTKK